MTDEHAPRAIDATRFPEDVIAFIEALGPGEELVITRDGEPIARISGAADAADAATRAPLLGVLIDPVVPDGTDRADRTDGADEEQSFAHAGVTVVVTAMELSESARVSLSDQLGPDYIVVDLHAAPATADVLLVPPVSPQLIAGLRSAFPRARVIVAEIEDDELGVSYQGPVRRLLDAGAEVYLPPATVPGLARQLDHTLTHRHRLTGGGSVAPLEIEPHHGV
ncbi:hypothetical protein ACM01_32520 [Streptomyces viridochromogenes]|uniref:Uncharacterized protein n=1 Tax=Streptomyces viridochromogenes TaxID=1938 RepID=A0A0J8BX73_STRVR|nr:hypothetical protein [Streptomyces viridochromogenes]KMS70095.1 hypothetical protein ACM01_32520 [Streptomyces viridochromogenes]KOG15238.1 hypothetical protein ADK36_29755 [Streptomyces viridochromogenes]KOG15464.1 hypothetical protein ADK35_29080 [Streptomyces viridochromogenes]